MITNFMQVICQCKEPEFTMDIVKQTVIDGVKKTEIEFKVQSCCKKCGNVIYKENK